MERLAYSVRERMAMVAVVVTAAVIGIGWLVMAFEGVRGRGVSASMPSPSSRPVSLPQELRREAESGFAAMRREWAGVQQQWREQREFADFVKKRLPPEQ